jgi:hypothetical protein
MNKNIFRKALESDDFPLVCAVIVAVIVVINAIIVLILE